MTAPSTQPAGAPASIVQTAPVSEIDVSCRVPVLVMFISAAKWLVLGWAFELIASIKFHDPNFLAGHSWLTYGRVHPAFTNCVLYGFCLQAGLGVILWLLAQTGSVRLAQPGLITVGAAFWNLGVLVGIVGILIGDSTGFEHMEMPGYAAVLLLIGYLAIGVWGVVTFHNRRERTVLASHWFLLTALFWFPWIYSSAHLLLVTLPVRGMAQAVIAWWFSQNFLVVWLGLVGLGSIFYLVPRLAGRELHSHYTAVFTYWVLILFASWGGVPNSAPVPAWVPTLSTIGTVLSCLAFIAAPLNVCESLGCTLALVKKNSPLTFFAFAVIAFSVSGFARAACDLLDPTQTLHFTWFTPAIRHLQFYGFFAMVMFGAGYIILPRLLGVGLPWPKLVRAHLWLSMIGIVLIVLPLGIGGLIEQSKLVDPNQPFVEVMRSTLMFLRVSTVGDLLLLIGHVLFLANLAGLFIGFYRTRAVATYEELTEDLFKAARAKA